MRQESGPPGSSRYLVGFVPDDSGEDAVALGRLLTTDCRAELTVCTVVPQTAMGGDAAFGGSGYHDLVAEKLRPVYERMEAEGDSTPTRYSVRFAPSAAVGLLDYAAELDATMLVLGSARSGVSGRYAIGSVGGLLQHASPVPLAFAPEGFAQAKVSSIRRVACGINDSPDSRQALDAAVELSRIHQVPLQLVNFVFPEYPSLRHLPGLGSSGQDLREQSNTAEQLLVQAAESIPEDIQVQTYVRSGGNIAQAVARAEWRDGDLLVLGSAPMGPFARVFLGSTALKLLRCCPAPVIAVPRPGPARGTAVPAPEESATRE